MRKTRIAVLLMMASTSLFVATGSATAATPTCDGKAATIVGTANADVSGTENADVIVSNGATSVAAGAGADRICMTGSPAATRIIVDAGNGGDRVFIRTAVRKDVTADLGHGNDLYIGGPGRDFVSAAPASYDPAVGPNDAGLDRIATGPGSDEVTVGQVDLPTRDVVRLGRHSDRLTVFGTAADGHIFDGNDGRDGLRQTWARNYELIPEQPMALDNTDEVDTIDDQVVLRWASLQDFKVEYHPAGVYFKGSHRPESIDSFSLEGASMGDNDDQIVVAGRRILGQLSGGRGRDLITAYGSREGYSTGDLTTGRIDYGSLPRPSDPPDVPFAGVEDLRILGDAVRLVGDDGPNRLDGYGCKVTIVAGGGNDTLLTTYDDSYDFGSPTYCARLDMFGGDGDDHLTGGAGADELYGGAGSDIADGRVGNDLCRAETRRNCERD